MPNLNTVELMGHLGSTPEIRYTQSGKAVASLSLATSRKIKEQAVTQWHKVIAWEWLAKQAEHFQKGDLVYVRGELTYRTWEKQDGTKAYQTEIVASLLVKCEWFKDGEAAPDPVQDDDLPF